MNNFIEEYQLVSEQDCDYIVDWFEDNVEYHRHGWIGADREVNTEVKDSTDISMDFREPNDRVTEIIIDALNAATEQYKKKYYHLDDIQYWSLFSGYNLQRYFPGQGYPSTHCEQNHLSLPMNMMVWTIYLNDVTDKGGTFFPYQRQLVSAKKGKVCIFPAPWTRHMHRGVISPTQTKYIATGWYSFDDETK